MARRIREKSVEVEETSNHNDTGSRAKYEGSKGKRNHSGSRQEDLPCIETKVRQELVSDWWGVQEKMIRKIK